MLILVGASATGKTEIVKELVKNYQMKKLVTCTTRPKRVGERDGVDYHFLTKEQFLNLKAREEFVESVEYNNNYYGTLKKDISDEKVVILEPNGLKSFYQSFPDKLFSVLIVTSKEIRHQRMIDRGDKEADIKKRLEHDDEIFEVEAMTDINKIIVNDGNDISKVTEEIFNLYKNQ